MANTVQLNLTVKDDGSVVLDKFVDTAKKGSSEAAKAATGASGSFSKMGASVVSVNAALELTQQVARLAGAAFDFIAGGAQKTGEEYLRLSQQTGLTVEEISSMSLAAATADVSQEALALSTKKLSINMVDAASGGKESSAAFAALGVEVKNNDGTLRSVNDVFLDTIDALGSIQNQSERTAASQAVFGRSSQELAALIADGSGKIREQAELAAKLGLVWSGPAAQAADELGDQTTILKAALKGVSDEIGSKTIPSMTGLVSSTVDWIAENREAISLNIDRVFAAIAMEAGALEGAVDGVVGALSRLVGQVPGLSGLLATIKANVVEYYDLKNQAAAAAKSTDDLGRAFIDQAAKTRAAKDALDEYKAAVGPGSTDAERQRLAELNAEYDREKAALDAIEPSLTRHVTKTDQATRANEFLGQSLGTLRDKASLSEAAVAQFAKVTGLSVEEVRKLDAGTKPTAEQVEKLAKATGQTADEIRKALPGTKSFAEGMKKTGDEAGKTAQSLAQLAAQGAQFAAAQLDQAAATGDLVRTQEAYQAAIDASAKALQANLAVADAAAAAGKSDAEVTALRTKAEQDFATSVNAAADKVDAAYQREQTAQEALAATTADLQVAHDMEALAAANAAQVGTVYAKTVEDIEAANRQAVDAIEAKRGVTLNDAEAEKAVAEANEKTRQQLQAAEQQYRATAEAADAYGRIIDEVADTLADRALDLGFALLTGQASWKDAAKQLAGIFGSTAIDAIKDLLKPGLVDFFKGLAQPLLQGLGSTFSALAPNELAPAIAGATTNGAAVQAALSAGGATGASMATGLGTFLASAGPLALAAAGVGVFASGISDMVGGELDQGLIKAAIAVPGFGVAALVTKKLLDAFGVLGPDMRQRISQWMERNLTQALAQDTDYQQALEAGLAPLGIALTPAVIKTLGGASRQNDLLRAEAAKVAEEYGAEFMAGFSPAFTESISKKGAASTSVPVSDWIRLFFPSADAATQAYAQELAKSAASIEVASMGLTGADAITATEQLAAGYVNLAQAQGLSADEFVHLLETQNQAAGMSTQFLATLDSLNAGLTTQQGSLDQVAAAMSRAFGVPVDAGNLTDMFLQVAGATGDAKQAAALFATNLERMADENPAIRALVDSLDPPLTEALQNVEDGAQGAADAFRDLVGTVAADLANVVDAANVLIGDVSFSGLNDQLAALQDQLSNTDDAEVAEKLKAQIAAVEAEIDKLSPKVDVINDQIQDSLRSLVSAAEQDGALTVDEFASMLQELEILGTLPAGTVSDSTSALVDQIIAQFQVALKLTDEQVADLRAQIEAGGPIVPPEVTTPPVDQAAIDKAAAGTATVADNSQDAATAQKELAGAAGEVATAVGASTDEFAALAQAAGLSSEQVKAALAGVIGTVEDGQSLAAFDEMLANTIPVSLDELTQGVLGATGTWKGSFDFARGAVIQLYQEIDAVPTDKTITFHIVQDGDIPNTGDDGGGEGHAAGHWKVPGPAGRPFRTILHGGERVLSVEEDREYQRVRFGAGDAAAATAGPVGENSPTRGSTGSARAPSARSVAREVVRALTSDGSIRWLGVPATLNVADLARFVALEEIPRLSRAGYLKADPRTGVIGRDSSMPGRG